MLLGRRFNGKKTPRFSLVLLRYNIGDGDLIHKIRRPPLETEKTPDFCARFIDFLTTRVSWLLRSLSQPERPAPDPAWPQNLVVYEHIDSESKL